MRKPVLGALAVLLVGVLAYVIGKVANKPFPAGDTPEGAYVRMVLAIDANQPREMFAYLETEAQWASFTIQETRAKACALIAAHFPGGTTNDAYGRIHEDCDAKDGPGEFALIAQRRGWTSRLKKDLSGVERVEKDGARATILTARGTRYAFRIRDNGLWGLTMFTNDLLAESERATRDLTVVQASADDYARAKAGAPDAEAP